MQPPIRFPIRGNFSGISGRRVRRLELPDTRKRVILSRGADFRAALKVYRDAGRLGVVHARDREADVDSRLNKKQRLLRLFATRRVVYCQCTYFCVAE